MRSWHTACPDNSPEALIFATVGKGRNQGKMVPLDGKNFLQQRIHPIAEKLGIPKRLVNFQVLRRTLATDLQKFGTVKDTQAVLRHASPVMTLNEYVQPIPESVRNAVNNRTRSVLSPASVEAPPKAARAKGFRTPRHSAKSAAAAKS